MDFEDGLYFASAVIIGIGAGLLSPGVGLICFGVMLAFPPTLSILRSRPTRKKDGEK